MLPVCQTECACQCVSISCVLVLWSVKPECSWCAMQSASMSISGMCLVYVGACEPECSRCAPQSVRVCGLPCVRQFSCTCISRGSPKEVVLLLLATGSGGV